MRTSLHEIWGCAHGPVAGLLPRTRLLCGVAAFAACMAAPAARPEGSLFAVVVAALWVTVCRPPFRLVRVFAGLGLALFLPYFLLLPLLPEAAPGSRPAWVVPWGIVLHGMTGMLVSMGTVATLTASDLREALLSLPVPRMVSAILLQIVNQTATLFHETRRIAEALAVRGASGRGRAAWRVLASLPRTWLPRVMVRAERVAAAMELRGYGERSIQRFDRAGTGFGDVVALGAGLIVLAASVALRTGWTG